MLHRRLHFVSVHGPFVSFDQFDGFGPAQFCLFADFHTRATAMAAMKAFWNSPVGPKTTHFWGPVANWGFVAAVLLSSPVPLLLSLEKFRIFLFPQCNFTSDYSDSWSRLVGGFVLLLIFVCFVLYLNKNKSLILQMNLCTCFREFVDEHSGSCMPLMEMSRRQIWKFLNE